MCVCVCVCPPPSPPPPLSLSFSHPLPLLCTVKRIAESPLSLLRSENWIHVEDDRLHWMSGAGPSLIRHRPVMDGAEPAGRGGRHRPRLVHAARARGTGHCPREAVTGYGDGGEDDDRCLSLSQAIAACSFCCSASSGDGSQRLDGALQDPAWGPRRWLSGKGVRIGEPQTWVQLHGSFLRTSHTSDWKFGTPVATMPGAWRYRGSGGASWPGASIFGWDRWICNFYFSVAARTIVWADPSMRYTSVVLGQ